MDPHGRLARFPRVRLAQTPTPVEEMPRLREALGGGPRLLVKRDDALSFALGGNKVRKLELVAAQARAERADTLVTTGGVQSSHARITAAAAARLGMRCVLVLNGARPERLTGNALLQHLLGAEIRYVGSRAERAPAMRAEVERLRAEGRRPYEIPLGASVPLGALGYTLAVGELRQQAFAPDVIVHATGSAGTQAGLVAGCAIYGLPSRVLAIAADEPVPELRHDALELLRGVARLLGLSEAELADERAVEVDDAFVAPGYGLPSPGSEEALRLCAQTEGLFLDPVYTAKAMAGLIAHVRAGRFREDETVLFWHTGGLPSLFV